MYSVVLMAAMTTAAAEPGCFLRARLGYGCNGCHGCHGCHGCSGYVSSCHGCYGGCYGCHGCYSFYHGSSYAPVIVPPTKPELIPPPRKEEKKGVEDKAAKLIIDLPSNAKLFIDDQPMKTGVANGASRRVFRTPQLEKDQTYYYIVRAEIVRDGKMQSNTKRVILRAGEEVRASFSELTIPITVTAGR